MSIIERLNSEVSIYQLFDKADPPIKYLTDKKPCQISCPFHGEDKRPSARVYPDTNSFHCYVCSKSWTPVMFWAEANNWYKNDKSLDISRAIDDLSLRYNISTATFDWQSKFYAIKRKEDERKKVPVEKRRDLSNYYAWEITNKISLLCKDLRRDLREDVFQLWFRFDLIDLSAASWEEDLKNWYEHAKLKVDGQGLRKQNFSPA